MEKQWISVEEKCEECNGDGWVEKNIQREGLPEMDVPVTCSECNGAGKHLPSFRPGCSHSLDVNISYADDVVSTGSYSYLQKKWVDYLYTDRHNPSHWMPLPAPPIQQL